MTNVTFGVIMGVLGTLIVIFSFRLIGDSWAIWQDWKLSRQVAKMESQEVKTVVQCATCEKIKAHYSLHGELPNLPITGQKMVDGKRHTYRIIDTKKIRPAAENLAELERLTGYNPAKQRVKKPSNAKK